MSTNSHPEFPVDLGHSNLQREEAWTDKPIYGTARNGRTMDHSEVSEEFARYADDTEV